MPRNRRRSATIINHRIIHTVLLVVLLTVVTVTVAQPSFSDLYENFFSEEHYYDLPVLPGSNDAVIKTREFGDCFRCVRRDLCYWGECEIPIPPAVYWMEWFWAVLLVFAATLEVLFRGFTLGFGVRMLRYLFLEPIGEAATTRAGGIVGSYRRRALVSAISGLSLAFFCHGSSILFPASLREAWFAYGRERWRRGAAAAATTATTHHIPPAIHGCLRRSLTEKFRNRYRFGTDNYYYDCPLLCTADGGFDTGIDWSGYVLGRIGSGLVFLTTTLEVLLRGFSLGFGARMLKFLFFPDGSDLGDPGFEREASCVPDDNDDDDDDGREKGDDDDLFRSFQHRAIVSAISGVSVASVVHGASLFVPAELREQWFEP